MNIQSQRTVGMSNIDLYKSLNLGRQSEEWEALFSLLSDEANRTVITLTSTYNANGLPPYLTPGMAAWYSHCIKPKRSPALAEVVGEFQSRAMPRGNRGILLEHEEHKALQEKLRKIDSERDTFNQIGDVEIIREELADKRGQYEALKAQHGRDAIKWTPRIYWFILVCIMIPEFLINWESFMKIPYLMNTPALVLGSVGLVAVFFGFSSHRVGMILKQWGDRFGGSVAATERWKSAREFSGGIVLFSIGMAIVVWGRYLLVADIIRESAILNGQQFGLEQFWLYAGTVLGNVGVWVFGILWSFVKHDSVQTFSELRSEVEELTAKQSKLIDRYLTRRNQQHILAAQKALDQLKKQDAAQRQHLQGYNFARQMFEEVKNKDSEVIGVLVSYRNALLNKCSSNHQFAYFEIEDITRADVTSTVRLTVEQYNSKPIELTYL